MNVQNRGAFFTTLVILLFLLVFLSLSMTYGPKERLIPLGVVIPCVMLALLLLLGEKYPRLIRRFELKSGLMTQRAIKKADGKNSASNESGKNTRVIIICLWSVAFFLMTFLFGFVMAIPLYLLLFLRFYGGINWMKSAAITAVTWGVVYLFFEVLLGEELFRGILFRAYVPPL